MALSEYHWLGALVLMLALTALLAWGLRRERRADAEPPRRPFPTFAGAMADPPSSGALDDDAAEFLSPSVIEDRRLLSALWGADTPDLVVSFWAHPGRAGSRATACRQGFLPLTGDFEETALRIESEIAAAAEENRIEDRSRLLAACTFIQLPARCCELMVRTTPRGRGFAHVLFLLDPDGKLRPVSADSGNLLALLLGENGLTYREALSRLLDGDSPAEAEEFFLHVLDDDFTVAGAHCWMASCARRAGRPEAEVRRHLALATEFSPAAALPRLEAALLRGRAELRQAVAAIAEHVATRSDHSVHSLFLAAQSLDALQHAAAARILCETLLANAPRHPEASRLMKTIDRRDRGDIA